MLAKRIVAIVILVPLAVILIALSVANRASTVLTVDPFNPGNPALSYSAPLFVWLFGALLVGVVIGSAVTWLTQGKHRRRARDSKQEAARLLERAEAAERRNTSVANT
ncbi:lipopolysaccharide assembly protein LapA domain-containing protein [Ochrobactrum soli]|uniref:LapA family protein n=1 Tax=Ochrobactrum soli TaxID=2448455 RepID=A0A849KKA0_9HYPH|nr:LapA family protein [[Ochrobactrum] soli]NNU58959.1 LapA family protein [[Ochrobactrum] soli]